MTRQFLCNHLVACQMVLEMVDVSTAQADEYILMMRRNYLEMQVLNQLNHSLEQTSDGKANIHVEEKLTPLTATYTQAVDASFVAILHSNTTHQELFTLWQIPIFRH